MDHTPDSLALLHKAIDRIDLITDSDWRSSLDLRKINELTFHDRDRAPDAIQRALTTDTFDKFYGNKKYYSVTKRSADYVESWINANSCGKVVLDYACGNGGNAIKAAQAGATLSLGLDISSVSVDNARRLSAKLSLPNIRFFQADAENTKLPDESVDVVICSGMLHHLDLSFAFPELRRILRPGGRILAVEALDYNPAIKLYRLLTPDMRTDWEKAHILSFKDIDFASRFFDIGSIRFWHVVGYAGAKISFLKRFLDYADLMLERTPLIKRLAWIFTFELIKH